jgi:hypothetical protein
LVSQAKLVATDVLVTLQAPRCVQFKSGTLLSAENENSSGVAPVTSNAVCTIQRQKVPVVSFNTEFTADFSIDISQFPPWLQGKTIPIQVRDKAHTFTQPLPASINMLSPSSND